MGLGKNKSKSLSQLGQQAPVI